MAFHQLFTLLGQSWRERESGVYVPVSTFTKFLLETFDPLRYFLFLSLFFEDN